MYFQLTRDIISIKPHHDLLLRPVLTPTDELDYKSYWRNTIRLNWPLLFHPSSVTSTFIFLFDKVHPSFSLFRTSDPVQTGRVPCLFRGPIDRLPVAVLTSIYVRFWSGTSRFKLRIPLSPGPSNLLTMTVFTLVLKVENPIINGLREINENICLWYINCPTDGESRQVRSIQSESLLDVKT